MILGHDHLPSPDIPALGPPVHPIESLHPKRLAEWEQEQTQQGQAPDDTSRALERRLRAFGRGSVQWDPLSIPNLPRGWVFGMSDRKHIRRVLLQDINDLVTVYGMLMGCASLFISTHPERDPNIPSKALADYLFQRKTLFIASDNLSTNKDAVMQVVEAFVRDVSVPWTRNWEKRARENGHVEAIPSDGITCGLAPGKSSQRQAHVSERQPKLSSVTPTLAQSLTSPLGSHNLPGSPTVSSQGPIVDEQFDEWLAKSLAIADQNHALTVNKGSHNISKIPGTLLDLVAGIKFNQPCEPHVWAEWLISLARSVAPSQLATEIHEKGGVTLPLAQLLATSALQCVAQDM
ncbi:hypothetical protein JB92DRAFT_3126661 [Gautieria morchelliformis]|nr:hypothetical protein JB92DRAFT_3126661 [Gautieria morchelliformis]